MQLLILTHFAVLKLSFRHVTVRVVGTIVYFVAVPEILSPISEDWKIYPRKGNIDKNVKDAMVNYKSLTQSFHCQEHL